MTHITGVITTQEVNLSVPSKTYEEIIRVGPEVDKFYGLITDKAASDRSYSDYSVKYVELESELRSLYVRNLSRPLNEESTKISKSILELWVKYKKNHKSKN